jgi:hypothetical protein
MEPVWREKYRLWIPGEPVPKSTMTPPVVRKAYSEAQRQQIVKRIIATDKKWMPLLKTQDYQKEVAMIAKADATFPQFSKLDPIMLTFEFFKGMHGTGDLKNLEAGVEDGLQFSGKIPNDRQVTAHGETRMSFYAEEPGVLVHAEIDPIAEDYDWLWKWFKRNKKKTLEYARMRGIELR